MRSAAYPTFHEHDTTFFARWEDPKDPQVSLARNAAIKHLRTRGFRIQLDPEIKRHYPSIKGGFHYGTKGALEVKIHVSGRSLEIKFFQRVVSDHINGGEFNLQSRRQMPYLIGKSYELERRELAKAIRAFGLPNLETAVELFGMERVESSRRSLESFQGRGFYAHEIPSYNSTTAHRGTVADGDDVYFFGPYAEGGRISKGQAFRNINNMWWVLLPSGEVRNLASFNLYRRHDFDVLPRKHWPAQVVEKRMRAALAKAVEAEAFERAIRVRDALRRAA